MPVSLLGTGCYVPPGAATNEDLAQRLDTSDAWIQSHLGICERRLAGAHETTSMMAAAAAQSALAQAEVEQIDGLIVATQTPDKIIPAAACLVQHRLGLRDCFAVDINAACSGFVFALHLAAALVRGGTHRRVLAIGADRLSRLVNWRDRTTCVIFGDGAGAALVANVPEGAPRRADIVDSLLLSDGEGEEVIEVPAGGSSRPLTHHNLDAGLQYVHMEGRRVFEFACSAFVSTLRTLTERVGLQATDLDYVIPHQANLRIIERAMEELGLPMARAITNLERYGNTSSASVPIALDEASRGGAFRPGQLLGLVAFGTGLAWGGALLRWQQ